MIPENKIRECAKAGYESAFRGAWGTASVNEFMADLFEHMYKHGNGELEDDDVISMLEEFMRDWEIEELMKEHYKEYILDEDDDEDDDE